MVNANKVAGDKKVSQNADDSRARYDGFLEEIVHHLLQVINCIFMDKQVNNTFRSFMLPVLPPFHGFSMIPNQVGIV